MKERIRRVEQFLYALDLRRFTGRRTLIPAAVAIVLDLVLGLDLIAAAQEQRCLTRYYYELWFRSDCDRKKKYITKMRRSQKAEAEIMVTIDRFRGQSNLLAEYSLEPEYFPMDRQR